jgi:predicted nuclease of predicted toxin-antitoxin system
MSPGAVRELRDAGHDVVYMADLGPDPGDRAVLRLAASEARILITLDNDFGELAIVHRERHAGIIRIIEESVWVHARMCQRVLDRHAEALAAGAIAVVEPDGRIRLWLPQEDA